MSGYYHRPLAGIGGWLTFFLIIVGGIWPLRILIETISVSNDAEIAGFYADVWPLILGGSWALTAIQLGMCAYMFWRLVRVHTWRTVRIVVVLLWVANIAIPAADLLFIAAVADLPVGALVEGTAPELIRGPIFAALWTAYLLRSERVANTYTKPGEADEMAEVFS